MLPWLDYLSSVLAQVVRLQRCVALAERMPPQPKQVSHCLWTYISLSPTVTAMRRDELGRVPPQSRVLPFVSA